LHDNNLNHGSFLGPKRINFIATAATERDVKGNKIADDIVKNP